MDSILKEIDLLKEEQSPSAAETLYIGGGTPSLLKTDNIGRLVNKAQKTFSDNPGFSEITIEVNPDDVSYDKLRAYDDCGINRISLGTQSFHDHELEFLGRRHNSIHNQAAVATLRDAGFSNFSLDLIFALPAQTLEDFQHSLHRAIELDPAHISLYCLTYEHGTPLYERLSKNQIKPLDDDLQADMFGEAMDYLDGAGFIQYEISNFAKPGAQCSHNLNYWKAGEYIGLGPSAHSHQSGIRRANHARLEKYFKDLEDGKLPVSMKEKLNPGRLAEEYLMLSLRLKEGVDLNHYQRLNGEDLRKKKSYIIDGLKDSGLAELKGNHLRLTDRGKFLADEIISRLA